MRSPTSSARTTSTSSRGRRWTTPWSPGARGSRARSRGTCRPQRCLRTTTRVVAGRVRCWCCRAAARRRRCASWLSRGRRCPRTDSTLSSIPPGRRWLLERLDVGHVEVLEEQERGVPWCRTIDGSHVRLLLKSGNFGSDRLLVDAAGLGTA
ncbi:hypothetical protein ER308_08575 [Egibacter rhizosphaerae]|uniref:Four-carbon acid sugar kinase nucleotide binding domain-containing protein n=1 Tax=Egibacter rhizosphaerae TaxID=1670831 RepID=A0A411YEI0_9ACTN|nr:hypothetical protein ER308_08575 [Egibacter rhizosphaerae]